MSVSNVPGERTSPTRFPTNAPPFDLQGITDSDLLDLIAGQGHEALDVVKRYQMGGPLFPPPVVSTLDGPLATLEAPSDVGGANWPAGHRPGDEPPLYPLPHQDPRTGWVRSTLSSPQHWVIGGQVRAAGHPGAPPVGGARGGATVQVCRW